ncbi:hypothetical protein [Cryptosporangium sp. NPDC051539]|uniref:hypothetical protein n=1 Tax=Cryptosporangium sp. NPDC051539 TaxID=3363962 RepID=UPI00378797A0
MDGPRRGRRRPPVEGPIAALLLPSTGRTSAVHQLHHADVDALAARVNGHR